MVRMPRQEEVGRERQAGFWGRGGEGGGGGMGGGQGEMVPPPPAYEAALGYAKRAEGEGVDGGVHQGMGGVQQGGMGGQGQGGQGGSVRRPEEVHLDDIGPPAGPPPEYR